MDNLTRRAVDCKTLDILRIESGLVFSGYEFNDQIDPFEAGIGFTVDLSTKEEDFSGKPALVHRKEHPQRVLVGLELEGNEPASHGDCVHVGRSHYQRDSLTHFEKEHRALPDSDGVLSAWN